MRPRLLVLAAGIATMFGAAHAHDTWFAPLPDDATGGVTLALGTGNRFPLHDSGIDAKYLVRSGCRAGPDQPLLVLQAVADAPNALELRVPAQRGRSLSCWAQTSPFEVALAPDKIAVYLKDIQAPIAVRDAWAAMSARGVTWNERYTKHARIELNPGAGAASPVDMAMDIVLESPQRTPRRGEALQFLVLRDGQPLPDFAVELRGDRSALGLWRKTDAEGRVRFNAPLAGRWVLRGTDLRPSDNEPDRWESRFVTLAFEVEPAQIGSSLNTNTLSANQTSAMPAITSEPPAITTRR